MKKFDEMNYTEKEETAVLIGNWLKTYTHEVIVKVLARRDEILNNEFTMNLLKELKCREERERKEFDSSMRCLLEDYNTFAEYNPHNHALTHAGSYRDVLYDMYIREI